MNLDQIQPHLIHNFSSEAELLSAIEKVGVNFTTNRERLAEYVNDPKLVSAYTCLYALTNIPKLKAVLTKIPELDLEQVGEIVDIGSGPGTFSLAALEGGFSGKLFLWDQSSVMLEQAQKLCHGLFPSRSYSFFQEMEAIDQKAKPRLGLFGHSANEMQTNQIMHIIDKLQLDEVLFIEPGTSDFFPHMLQLRTALIEKGFQILFPCPSTDQCPMAQNDWCHQFVKVTHGPDIERICQKLKLDRKLLPLTLHYYSKLKVPQKNSGYRIIRRYKPLKFAQPFEVCRGASTIRVEVLFKGLSKKLQKDLQNKLAGDIIQLEIVKEIDAELMRARWLC